ncbi:UNVERIFIED_CONTAM: hypothetical protein Slati_4568200 [Sesamum latifolium]|uniref:Uncharacterized protein n=1 Tax=Sesamum latifolium TaxID=2727402 RepID=A0AAW2SFS7_9LAMI
MPKQGRASTYYISVGTLLKRRIEGIEEAVGITGVEGRSYCSRTRLVLLEYALFSFLAGERSI